MFYILKRDMASKVYTKKGDKGYTLVMGTRTRFPKYHPRINAIGTVGELNSNVGMIRSYNVGNHDIILKQIQNDLFNIGAGLADTRKEHNISIEIDILEASMDTMSKSLAPLKDFILPTGNQPICFCHIARTVCRRAERAIVELSETEDGLVDPTILSYINRLSDYFFVLARKLSQEMGIIETHWEK